MTKKTRVMIVDDEADFLILVKLCLEETNKFEVLTSSNANNIVSQARAFEPDVILLDILMPGVSGLEACALLRADPRAKRVPVIMLSALDSDHAKRIAADAGSSGFLTKPIGKKDLIGEIEKAVGSREKNNRKK